MHRGEARAERRCAAQGQSRKPNRGSSVSPRGNPRAVPFQGRRVGVRRAWKSADPTPWRVLRAGACLQEGTLSSCPCISKEPHE